MSPGVERQIDKMKFYCREALEDILKKNDHLLTIFNDEPDFKHVSQLDFDFILKEKEAIHYLLDKKVKKD